MSFFRFRSWVVLFLLFAGSSCNSQPDPIANDLKAQADKMGALFLKGDMKSFVKFTHPAVMEQVGGEEAMIKMLESSIGKDFKLTKVEMGQPGKIVKWKQELQSTIEETIEVEMPQGKLRAITTLLAISKDEGKTWYFVDARGDLNELRKIIPEISPEIKVPAPVAPIRID